MKLVARVLFGASIVIAVGLAIWVGIDLLIASGTLGAWPWAVVLWLGTGGPLVVAGLVIAAYRARRSSMMMPSHMPDGKRN